MYVTGNHKPPDLDAIGSAVRGRYGRRQFLQRAVASGMSLSAAAALLDAAGVQPAGAATIAKAPKRGGVLTFATDLEPIGFDVVAQTDTGSLWTTTLIYDRLVTYTPGSYNTSPALAESWDISDGGKTYTFHLRKNVRFSNGMPMTSEDVKYMFDNLTNPKVNINYYSLAAAIKSVSAPDPSTIVMKLKYVEPAVLQYLTVYPASIRPKALLSKPGGDKQLAQHPVGTGPFAFQSWAHGSNMKLVRNPHYWGAGQPYLDGIEFQFTTDQNTRVLSLQSGQVDAALDIPFSQIKALDKSSSTHVQVTPSINIFGVFLNNEIKPFDDLLVRQALAYATDKAGINQAVYFGFATIANGLIPFNAYSDNSVKNYPFSISTAKKLLARSSAPNGFDVTIMIPSGDAPVSQACTVIQADWAQLGVNLTIQTVDPNALWTEYSTKKNWGQAAIPLITMGSDTLSPDELCELWLNPSGATTGQGLFTGYENKKVIAMIDEVTSTLDEKTRKKLFGQIQRETLAAVPWIPLFFQPNVVGLRSNVQNFHTLYTGYWALQDTWLA